jgi:hypothetical protein
LSESSREAKVTDVTMWQDRELKLAFEARARARFEEIRGDLQGLTGVVAIEPESGEHFVGPTLGKANDAAYEEFPDRWLYFVRIEAPTAAVALPTW